MKVVGVDGFADRWITVVLDEGMFYAAAIFPDFEAILREHGSAATIAVDIPIGLPPPYRAPLMPRPATSSGPGAILSSSPPARPLPEDHRERIGAIWR